MLFRLTAAGVAATVSLALPSELLAGGEWPNGPNKTWFQNLQRPDNNQHPYRQSDPKSLFCCGIADTVKTRFKVKAGNERYPEDRWFAWLKDEWVLIPSENRTASPTSSYCPAPSSVSCGPRADFKRQARRQM